MCARCNTQRASTILLVHEIERGQSALLTAHAIHARRPTSRTQHRVQKLKVAVALSNAELGDVAGPLPGDEEPDDGDHNQDET